MGSIDAACIAGFLCRLCSEMHRTVIHIYGDQGQKHDLAGKINAYLPVTIKPNDPLPKTICKSCMKRVQQHHELMVRIQKHRDYISNNSSVPVKPPTTTTTTTTAAESQRQQLATNSDDNMETGESTTCNDCK